MKTLRILSLLSFGLTAFACGSPTSAQEEVTSAVTASPVRLLRADYDGYNGDSSTIHGAIGIESLAEGKEVIVHYSWRTFESSGADLSVSAHYERMLTDGRELWTFGTPPVAPSFRGADFDFTIEYRVAGQIYHDDNHGQPYGVGAGYLDSQGHPWIVLGEMAVAMSGISFTPRGGSGYLVEIDTRNVSNAKVTVVWTADHWQTTQTTAATWSAYLTAQTSQWNALLRMVDRPIELAVSFDHDGKTDWDNDFGRNYQALPTWHWSR